MGEIMKKTAFKTRTYVFRLINSTAFLIILSLLYYHNFMANRLTGAQELALTISILGSISDISVATYRYVYQYRDKDLRRHQPKVYLMDMFMSHLTVIGFCYYGSTVSRGVEYCFFAIAGWLSISLFIISLGLSFATYFINHIMNKGE